MVRLGTVVKTFVIFVIVSLVLAWFYPSIKANMDKWVASIENSDLDPVQKDIAICLLLIVEKIAKICYDLWHAVLPVLKKLLEFSA